MMDGNQQLRPHHHQQFHKNKNKKDNVPQRRTTNTSTNTTTMVWDMASNATAAAPAATTASTRTPSPTQQLMMSAAAGCMTPIVTMAMLTCQLCQQRFSMSGKLNDHRTPVMAVNPSQSIEGPYCIACAGKRDGLKSFQIDEARVALCKLMQQQQQFVQQNMAAAAAAGGCMTMTNMNMNAYVVNAAAVLHHQQQQAAAAVLAGGNTAAANHKTAAVAAGNNSTLSTSLSTSIVNKPQDAPGKTSTLGRIMDDDDAPAGFCDLDHHNNNMMMMMMASSTSSSSATSAAAAPSNNNGKKNGTKHGMEPMYSDYMRGGFASSTNNSTSTSNKRPKVAHNSSTSSHATFSNSNCNSSGNSNYSKSSWTAQEDAIVMHAVQTSSEQPFTRWSDLAHQLPGRIGKQIRDRWLNHLDPKIDRTPFSRDDDLKLYHAYKQHGKRWVEISTRYFDSKRSENHIKNRWYSAAFKKFVQREFSDDGFESERLKCVRSSSSTSTVVSSLLSHRDSPFEEKKDTE